MSGKKIIDGLKDAVDGNFGRVTIEGQTWVRLEKPEAGVTINIRLSKELKSSLERAAKDNGKTLSEFIRSAAMLEACRILGPLKLVKSD